VAGGLLFVLVTWQVAAGGPLRAADERLGRAAFGHGPRAPLEFLADLGGVAVAAPVLAAAAALRLWRGGRAALRAVLPPVLAPAAVPALVVPLKALIARPAPLQDATGWYPSGHTATAMVAYCGAALLLAPYLRTAWTMPAALALTVATGTGLVFRGYHWPLDVVGSIGLCGVLVAAAALLAPRPPGAGSRVRSPGSRRRSCGRTRSG
jgi:membrane-associated phospholipid phosphatase